MDEITHRDLERQIPWHNQACGICGVSAESHTDPHYPHCDNFEWRIERWMAARPQAYIVAEHERRLTALEAKWAEISGE